MKWNVLLMVFVLCTLVLVGHADAYWLEWLPWSLGYDPIDAYASAYMGSRGSDWAFHTGGDYSVPVLAFAGWPDHNGEVSAAWQSIQVRGRSAGAHYEDSHWASGRVGRAFRFSADAGDDPSAIVTVQVPYHARFYTSGWGWGSYGEFWAGIWPVGSSDYCDFVGTAGVYGFEDDGFLAATLQVGTVYHLSAGASTSNDSFSGEGYDSSLDLSWGDPGIITSDIPEPSSVLLVAVCLLGSYGIQRWRRKR